MKPTEKLIASHIVLLGLIALAFLPEEQPYNQTSVIGWWLYFLVLAVTTVMAIRSWIDYAQYRRDLFIFGLLDEIKSVSEVAYLGDKDEPYDYRKEVHDPWIGVGMPDEEYWADLLRSDNKQDPDNR